MSKIKAIEDIFEDISFTSFEEQFIVDIAHSMTKEDIDEYLIDLEIQIRDEKIQSIFQ